jgi:Domain of unknown function (DUF4249)
MNRNHFGKYIFGILILIATLSCEEQTDWAFQPQENEALVVEAIITNEFKPQEIRLSLTYSELNGQAVPASGATIVGSDGQGSLNFIEDPNKAGRYLSELPFAAQLGVTYQIEIQWNGQTFQAENEMIEVYPFNKMTFRPFGETDSLTVGEVAPIYSPYEQAMYEIDIDWSHLTNSDSSHAKLFFYTFSTVDATELFKPAKETVVFPKGSIVIEKKHSLNNDFAAFYRALAMETEWQGGVYDENAASLPSNISNGGVGFFGVSAVLSDTLIAE